MKCPIIQPSEILNPYVRFFRMLKDSRKQAADTIYKTLRDDSSGAFQVSRYILCVLLPFTIHFSVFAQTPAKDTLDHKVIYGHAVKADIRTALSILDSFTAKRPVDSIFKTLFEARFKYDTDRTIYFDKKDTTLNPLHRLFQVYWRDGLLNSEKNSDSTLISQLISFLQVENKVLNLTAAQVTVETLPAIFEKYIRSKDLYCTAFGKTGKFYDLIVWKKSIPVNYELTLPQDTINVTVNFLSDFITLGWLEYARLGNYYPGGWATKEGLYCVEKGYDTTSEKFKVNFLKHEAQHFSDYKSFPNLSSNDLEYRGKLTELSFNLEELYNRIEYFINNAKNDKENSHPFANYWIIRHMSEKIFKTQWETDIKKWRSITPSQIQHQARKLLVEHTTTLQRMGKTGNSAFN